MCECMTRTGDGSGPPGSSTSNSGETFLKWYLTLFTGIVATLCLLVLAAAAVSPFVVSGGFLGGNLLLMAGIGFVGSALIVLSVLPEPSRVGDRTGI